MPHSPRQSLLIAGLALLLLPSPRVLADPLPPTKSPRPRSVSLPSDPALLSLAQRLKLAQVPLPAMPAAPRSPRPGLASTHGGLSVAPVEVSAADRAMLAARLKAKLEAHRFRRFASARRGPRADKPADPGSTILVGPPGLTPAERAKAEAAGRLRPRRRRCSHEAQGRNDFAGRGVRARHSVFAWPGAAAAQCTYTLLISSYPVTANAQVQYYNLTQYSAIGPPSACARTRPGRTGTSASGRPRRPIPIA